MSLSVLGCSSLVSRLKEDCDIPGIILRFHWKAYTTALLRYSFNKTKTRATCFLDECCYGFTQDLWCDVWNRMKRMKGRFRLLCLNKWLYHCLQVHIIEPPQVYPVIRGVRTNAWYTHLLPGYDP